MSEPCLPPPTVWTECAGATIPDSLPSLGVPPQRVHAHGNHLFRLDFGSHAMVAKRLDDVPAGRLLSDLMRHAGQSCPHVPEVQLFECRDRSYAWLCSPYLDGTSWLSSGRPHVNMAAALVSLHEALRPLVRPEIVSASLARRARVLDWLVRHSNDDEIQRLAGTAGVSVAGLAGRIEAFLGECAQPIHHDLHAGNIWWSAGKIWFLDFEEATSAYLPVIADVMRFVERHIFLPAGNSSEWTAELPVFFDAYFAAPGVPRPTVQASVSALAWNWLDSWATLDANRGCGPSYDSERMKFLRILGFYEMHGAALERCLLQAGCAHSGGR